MKMVRIVVMVLLLAAPAVSWSAELGLVRLSLVTGDVQVQPEDDDEWVPAAANMPLAEGDRIWVPDGGRAEVQIRGGVYLRLDARTALDIVELGGDSYQFHLAEGRAYINNRKGGIDHIQVDTPHASAGIFDNSLVMVDAPYEETTDVSVIRGYALVETARGRTRVAAGNALRLADGTGAEIAPIDPPDAWEKWNRGRDRRLDDAAESLRYIPDELDDYAYDLDDHGRWHYLQEYGYVWAPRISLSATWSPYRQGRWAWVRGSYVWISYEPWGWVPYHYGRWAYAARIGWCWVPPTRGTAWWGPGYVGWVHTPTTVAWVPLAPGEVYYGYGNYGSLSVNITNVTVPRTVVRDYRHIHVRNAVTVVHRDTFMSGKKQQVTVRQNPFVTGDGSVGPPRFRPEREARRPVIKAIPAGRRPPERVKRVTVEEIRRERRVVVGEKGSVFTPGQQPRDLPVYRREAPRRAVVKPPVPVAGDRGVQTVPPRREPARETVEPRRRSPGAPAHVPAKRLEEPRARPSAPAPSVTAPTAKGRPSHPAGAAPAVQTPPLREQPAVVAPQTGDGARGEGRPQRRGGERREMKEQGAPTASTPVPAQQSGDSLPARTKKGLEKPGKEEQR